MANNSAFGVMLISSPYLDTLDTLLRKGLENASDAFREAQTRFVHDCRQPDGGFRGRAGGSDLYYTDFALRCLFLLSEDASVLLPPQKFLQSKKNSLASVVDCFSFLNAHRMLKHPIEHLDDIRAVLQRYLLPQGGFSRTPGENGVSAYQTFLGSLCLEMLGEEMPNKKEAAIAIEQLKRPAGGYTEFAGQTEPQTSATAAAVAVLMLHGELNEERGADAIRFLLNSQCRDGGLAAHASLEIGDLLSTFTGSLTLAGLNAIDSLDLANLAEFLRQTSSPDGGFTACTADTVPDVEYTYYGLATYSLLRQVG